MYNIFPGTLLSSMHYGGGQRQTLTIKIGLNIYRAPQAMLQVNNGKHVTPLLWSLRSKLGLSFIYLFIFLLFNRVLQELSPWAGQPLL